MYTEQTHRWDRTNQYLAYAGPGPYENPYTYYVSDFGVYNLFGKYTSKSSARTPNYRMLKALGKLPDNNFGAEVVEFQYPSAYKRYTNPLNGLTSETSWSGYNLLGIPWAAVTDQDPKQAALQAQVRNGLLKKGREGDFLAPVFLGEAKKTAGEIEKLATTAVHVLKELRKGNFYGAAMHAGVKTGRRRLNTQQYQYFQRWSRDGSRAAANAWLQLQYGLLPLAGDVQSALRATMDALELPPGKRTVEIHKAVKLTLHDTEVVTTNFNSDSIRFSRRTTTEYKTACRWIAEVGTVDEFARFGIADLPLAAWELTWGSFLLDWVLPIGDWLGSLSANLRYSNSRQVWGFKVEGRQEISSGSFLNPDTTGWISSGMSKKIAMWRGVVYGTPQLSLTDLMHLTGYSQNVTRMYNALALFRSGLKF